jgi:TRAP transporter TAXI family solute receptor
MSPFQLRNLPRNVRTRKWLITLLIFAVLLLVSLWWLRPAPPKKIKMATGHLHGVYATLGEGYHDQLKDMGLEVEVVHTSGSVDNLQRLVNGEVDVALVQGGTYAEVNDPDGWVRGLAAVGREPLWVFYRSSAANPEIKQISDFLELAEPGQKVRIALGSQGSGTEALAQTLLREHGISKANADLSNSTLEATARQLKAGELEVGFFVTSYRHRSVAELLQDPNIHLLTLRRQLAYARRFPYLYQVTLPEGVLDLQNNLPSEDKELLAPTTLLVCRADLHPRTVEQILQVSDKIHKTPSLLAPDRRYPSAEGVEAPLKMHAAATQYLESGESFLARLIPYWVLRHVLQLQILLLPLLVAFLPYLRVVPWVYRFRINRLLRQHYRVLRELEEKLEETNDPEILREGLKALDDLRSKMEVVSRKVPWHLQREVYHWRLHVIMVRNEILARLRTLESGQTPSGSNMIERSIHAPGLADSHPGAR